MTNPISRLAAPAPVEMIELNPRPEADPAAGFGDVFAKAVAHVDQFQKNSQQMVDRFLQGEQVEVHDMVMAGQRAEIAFEMFMQVRNKVVQAYQEVMRMQI